MRHSRRLCRLLAIGTLAVLVWLIIAGLPAISGLSRTALAKSIVSPAVLATLQTPKLVFREMTGVTFVDSQHGWMLASYEVDPTTTSTDSGQTTSTVDTTTDGGLTWQTQSVLCSRPFLSAPDCVTFQGSATGSDVRYLLFTNLQDGWAYGPALRLTHDSGKTWQAVHMAGNIMALHYTGNILWALQGHGQCTNYPTEPIQCQELKVLWSRDGGDTWQSTEIASDPEFVSSFVPVDNQVAWLLMPGHLRSLTLRGDGLVVRVFNVPGPCTNTLEAYLAAIDNKHLWLTCGFDAGGGLGSKWVYTSENGAQSWTLKAKVSLPSEADDGGITAAGYVRNLYAFSTNSAWMTMARGVPVGTSDGGKTWYDLKVIPAGIDPLDENIIGVSNRDLWLYSDTLLLRTHNGGSTWICERAYEAIGDGPACFKWGNATDPRNDQPRP